MSLPQITLDAALFYSTTGVSIDASGNALFRRKHAFRSGGQLILPGVVTAAYANGAFTTPLYLHTPDDADEAAAYSVTIGGATYDISISGSAPLDLALLIATAGVEDVSAVSTLLSLYTLKATYDAQVAAFTTAIAGKLTQADADLLYAALGHTSVKASAGALGHIRVGANLSIDGDGILSASGGETLTWQSLTPYLGAGWVQYGSGFGPGEFAIGTIKVYFRGAIARSSGTADPLAMPVAARPAFRRFAPYQSQTGPGQLNVLTTGVIQIWTGGVLPVDLTNSSYDL
jgi:hypothetical protein